MSRKIFFIIYGQPSGNGIVGTGFGVDITECHASMGSVIFGELVQLRQKAVCDRIGMPYQSLPRKNVSNHRRFQGYYDNDSKQLVARHWAREIELFSYSFEDQRQISNQDLIAKNADTPHSTHIATHIGIMFDRRLSWNERNFLDDGLGLSELNYRGHASEGKEPVAGTVFQPEK